MAELAKKKCQPCEDKSGKLNTEETGDLLAEIDKWKIVDDKYIEKTLQFKDFASALSFINKVGDIAEAEGHHPDICLFSWNKVTFKLSTHSVAGLTENDFILAAKIDGLARE